MTEHQYGVFTRLIDRYVIQRYIAEGGMQEVYLAVDQSFDRLVALKVPKNASAEKRFQRSAIVSARINHGNIAKTLDFFQENGRDHLVEEFIPGENLSGYLRGYEKLDPHLAAHIFHHLAKGLAAAHHAGVIHRDLKPSNIMVSGDATASVIKITDFGIAKLSEDEIAEGIEGGDASITGSQTVIGALPYMAPEMTENPRAAGQPADVWALGAILHQLLTGNLPFGSGLQAVKGILMDEPPAIPDSGVFSSPQFNPLVQELTDIRTRCLQKDPSVRPTADELVSVCAKLCYSSASREYGTISNYAAHTGSWGFIQRDNGEGAVFFHVSAFYGHAPTNGQRVNFTAFPGSPRSRAFPVLPLL
ncbi:MAG TPA: protein kinase [Pseudomonadales bacterium]